MESVVMSHTLKLIHQGVFNRFSDQKISQVYINLLRSPSLKIDEQLIHFWYDADFSMTQLTLPLLQATNQILQLYKQPLLANSVQLNQVAYEK